MTTRRIRVRWDDDSTVTGWLSGSTEADTGVLLAHGAGAGQQHPFMVGIRQRLARRFRVLAFQYPYVEAGRRAPDRLERLLRCHQAAFDRLAGVVDRVVIAGKSMGGRVGGHLVAEHGVAASGLIYYGYPLVGIRATTPRPTDHIESLQTPQLFIQGSRDRLGPPELVGAVAARCAAGRMVVIDDADHGFSVPKRTGLGVDHVLDRLVAETVDFVEAEV
jgi:predicted alpha/beta-hydrolase family hydrolase